MIEKRFLKSQFVEKTRHWYLFYGICLNKSCPQNLIKLVLQRFFKLTGSTYSQPHSNIQLNDCISSRLVELLYWYIAALKSVRKVLGRQLHYWWTEFIISISEILRCFGQWLFNLMDMHFSKKVFLTKQYFCRYMLLFYNTGIHDLFNKLSFLKPINDTVSVAESGYL